MTAQPRLDDFAVPASGAPVLRLEPRYEPVEPAWMDEPAIGQRPNVRTVTDGLATISFDEIEKARPEPPPMLGIIPKVGLTVLAGPPKIGKSLLASQMALGLSYGEWAGFDGDAAERGEPPASTLFLGHDLKDEYSITAQAIALLVMEEGSLAGISYRLRHQLEGMGLKDPILDVAHRQRVRLDDRGSVKKLRGWVEQWQPALVVLDPLNRLHGADENRPTQMTPVMDAMAGLAYDFGIAVVAIHHLAKPSAERRGDIWDRFRGASSIRSGTDCNLAMDAAGSRVELVGEYRDAEPLRMFLELDRETLTFRRTEAVSLPGKIDRDALDAFLSGRPQVTVREVAVALGASKNTAQTALDSLGLDTYDGPRGTRFYVTGTAQ